LFFGVLLCRVVVQGEVRLSDQVLSADAFGVVFPKLVVFEIVNLGGVAHPELSTNEVEALLRDP